MPLLRINRRHPGAGTLFFVNDDGWALTCSHVVDLLIAAPQMEAKYRQFRADVAAMPSTMSLKERHRRAAQKHGYTAETMVELSASFLGCVDKQTATFVKHPTADLALLHFQGYTNRFYDGTAVFPTDTTGLKPGKLLCRLGFPFPQFTNFVYSSADDKIEWTDAGNTNVTWFPLEGMITRIVTDAARMEIGFEMSTPGLRGHSGGPVFDSGARVWGMQYRTTHLDLDFDVDIEVLRAGKKKRIAESAFLHVGWCVHVDLMKAFMREHNVAFTEA
jgi:hypothetical protein